MLVESNQNSNMENKLIQEIDQPQLPPMDKEMADTITWAKNQALPVFNTDKKGQPLTANEMYGKVAERSHYFVGQTPTGDKVVFGVVPRIENRNGKELSTNDIHSYEYAVKMGYLKAIRNALNANQINSNVAKKLIANAMGRPGESLNVEEAQMELAMQKYWGVPKEMDPIQPTNSEDTNRMQVVGFSTAVSALTVAIQANRQKGKAFRTIRDVAIGTSIVSITLGACAPVVNTVPLEKPTPKPITGNETPTPNESNIAKTNVRLEITDDKTSLELSANFYNGRVQWYDKDGNLQTAEKGSDSGFTLISKFQNVTTVDSNKVLGKFAYVYTPDGKVLPVIDRDEKGFTVLSYLDNGNLPVVGWGLSLGGVTRLVIAIDVNRDQTNKITSYGDVYFYDELSAKFYLIDGATGKGGNDVFKLMPDLKIMIAGAESFATQQKASGWTLKREGIDQQLFIVDSNGKNIGLWTGTSWQSLTLEATPTETATPAIETITFITTDGEKITMPDFKTPQEALEYVVQNTLWRTDDRFHALDTFFKTNDSGVLWRQLKKIVDLNPQSGGSFTLPNSGKYFFILSTVEIGDKTIVIFKDKDDKFVTIYIGVQETTFESFVRQNKDLIPTPTPKP